VKRILPSDACSVSSVNYFPFLEVTRVLDERGSIDRAAHFVHDRTRRAFGDGVIQAKEMRMTGKHIDPLPMVWGPDTRVGDMLKGLRGLVVGIANADSIAYGCAVKLHAFGADLAVTYLAEGAEKFVRPLAEQIWGRDHPARQIRGRSPARTPLRARGADVGAQDFEPLGGDLCCSF
jgi:hypothetical protein